MVARPPDVLLSGEFLPVGDLVIGDDDLIAAVVVKLAFRGGFLVSLLFFLRALLGWSGKFRAI